MTQDGTATAATPGMTLRDYFARAYVINLPHRTDRRKLMARELQRIGMPEQPGRVEFFPAIRPDDAGGFSGIGVRGCYLSHLSILRTARDQNLPNVLVLEDDLETSPDLKGLEPALVRHLRDSAWDLAFFFGADQAGVSPVAGGPPFVATDRPLRGAHFYAVNGRTLGPLVAFLEEALARPAGDPRGGPMHLDGAYNVFRRSHPDVVTLVATSDLSGQRSSRSDVADIRWFDRMPIVRQLANGARIAKHKLRGK